MSERDARRTGDARRDGARGERIALEWLREQGFTLVVKNLRLRWCGELDLVMIRDLTLHVIEVKTIGPFSRSSAGDPLVYYDLGQFHHLRRTLKIWLADSRTRRILPPWTDLSIDLVTVDQRPSPPVIRHHRAIMPPEGL
jgi:putative endonuclease